MRERDELTGKIVPATLITSRTLAEQFPEAPAAMTALNLMATVYLDLDEHQRAAAALDQLARQFPNNPHDAWYRLGELYEKTMRDIERAHAAYAQVPAGSSKYRDAQRKLR